MKQRIALVQGHPGRADHLGHALAAAYAAGATAGGHELRAITVATLDFPIVRDKTEWERDAAPDSIRQAQDTIRWASHLLIIHPLWLGSMPALLKAFFEQVFRPGFALAKRERRWKRLLSGRSAHLVVTMGMPALVYRLFFFAHGVRGFARGVLGMSGIKPVRTTLIGSVESIGESGRRRWLQRMYDDALHAR